ncbi:hypothetical protein QCA50_019751 [Cerrena zonata]|uniref:Uncharacterized protein n=1 Tax=Cerrena zonata TaxID=2478898 RepID=A0AAW0F8L1_9APHY
MTHARGTKRLLVRLSSNNSSSPTNPPLSTQEAIPPQLPTLLASYSPMLLRRTGNTSRHLLISLEHSHNSPHEKTNWHLCLKIGGKKKSGGKNGRSPCVPFPAWFYVVRSALQYPLEPRFFTYACCPPQNVKTKEVQYY